MAPPERRLYLIIASDPRSGRSTTVVEPFASAEEAADSIRRRGSTEILSVDEHSAAAAASSPPTSNPAPEPMTMGRSLPSDLVGKFIGLTGGDTDPSATESKSVLGVDERWVYVDGPTIKQHPRYIYCRTLSWFVVSWTTGPADVLLLAAILPGRRHWMLWEILRDEPMLLATAGLLVIYGVALLYAMQRARAWMPRGILLFHAGSAATILLHVALNGLSFWGGILVACGSIAALGLVFRWIFLMIYPQMDDLVLHRRISRDDPYAAELLREIPHGAAQRSGT